MQKKKKEGLCFKVESITKDEALHVEKNENYQNVNTFYTLTNIFKCVANSKEDEVEHKAKKSTVVQINFDEELNFLKEWLEKLKIEEVSTKN